MECDTISEELYKKLKEYPQYKGEFSSYSVLINDDIIDFQENDIVYIVSEKALYKFNGANWYQINETELPPVITSTPSEYDTNISLYDLNKNIMKTQKTLSDYAINQKIDSLNRYHLKTANRFYMLLFRDINYYTVFYKITGPADAPNISFGNEVIDCLKAFKKIYSIEIQKEDNTIEIWVQNESDEPIVGYLFPYDMGVVGFAR